MLLQHYSNGSIMSVIHILNLTVMSEASVYLFYLLREIVKNPDALTIVPSLDERGILLEVGAVKEDMGCILGKEGRTIKAIRHLMHVYGSKKAQCVSVKVVEPA